MKSIRNFFSFLLMLEKLSLIKQKMWKRGIRKFWSSSFSSSILKMYFLKKQFFWGRALKIYFLRVELFFFKLTKLKCISLGRNFWGSKSFSKKIWKVFCKWAIIFKKNLKCIFWGRNFWSITFKGTIFFKKIKMYFLTKQFYKYVFWGSNFKKIFWNACFEGSVLKCLLWGSNLFLKKFEMHFLSE